MRAKIQWNGVNYGQEEFLRLAHTQYPEVIYWRRRGDTEIPAGKLKKRDLEGWMAFVGASWLSSSTTTDLLAPRRYSASVTTR